jgi:hypothetical protein
MPRCRYPFFGLMRTKDVEVEKVRPSGIDVLAKCPLTASPLIASPDAILSHDYKPALQSSLIGLTGYHSS